MKLRIKRFCGDRSKGTSRCFLRFIGCPLFLFRRFQWLERIFPNLGTLLSPLWGNLRRSRTCFRYSPKEATSGAAIPANLPSIGKTHISFSNAWRTPYHVPPIAGDMSKEGTSCKYENGTRKMSGFRIHWLTSLSAMPRPIFAKHRARHLAG